MENITQHKGLFIASLILISLLMITALVFLISSLNNKTPVSVTPTPSPKILERHNGYSLVSFTPSPDVILTPGQRQTFTVTFADPISDSDVIISLNATPIGSDTLTPLAITTTVKDSTLTITSKLPLAPNTGYILTIKNIKTDTLIFSKQYATFSLPPTPVESNNKTLAQYLPYKTNTWMLTYDQNQNLYYFNALINPYLSQDVNSQFEQQKSEALDFIKSKGIDPSTLQIIYKR